MKLKIVTFYLFLTSFFIYIPQAQSNMILDANGNDLLNAEDSEIEIDFNPNFNVVSFSQQLYTTTGNPFDPIYLVQPGEGFDGVADLFLDSVNIPEGERCTGALLYSGKDVLTAAHCLTDNQGVIDIASAEVNFDTPSGRISFDVTPENIFLAPGWDGVITNGNDLAILKLDTAAPESVDHYEIYRQFDEINQIGTKVGYGRSGNGNQGDILETGVKRRGLNRYDADGTPRSFFFGGATTGILGYDFDNGLPSNDAFRFFYNRPNLGLGFQEVGAAPGDSGSPTFINNQIAGVTAFRETLFFIDSTGSLEGSDVDFALNSSFGEFMYDNRVSTHANWIDKVIEIPEPSSMLVALLGMYFIRILKSARTEKATQGNQKQQ